MTMTALNVTFDDDTFSIELSDGRVIRAPLFLFPRLLYATAEQREHYQLSSQGIHWDAIDENVSIEGVLAGRREVTKSMATVACECYLSESQGLT